MDEYKQEYHFLQIHWRDGKVQDIPSFELRWKEKELERYNNVCS
jgi:hypothetical protein